MGKYRHGPVHKRKKRWSSKADNLKQDQARIEKNRAVLAELKKS